MKLLASLIAFSLGCLAAVAMGQPTPEMQQAIVRIRCGSSAGTGCLVGKDGQTGLVVTCNHLFDGESAAPIVMFPNGQTLQGQVVAADPSNDLAAIAIPSPLAAPVPLANYRPDKGERIHSAGFGSTETNRLAVNSGTVLNYTDRGDKTFPGILISGSVRSGDSGGPMFNDRGEVAAVLWGGAEGGGVVGTGSAKLSAVLMQCQGRVCQPYRIQPPQQQWQPSPPQYQPIVRPAQPQQPAAQPLAAIPPKTCNCNEAALIARITKLEAAYTELLARQGTPGPPGKQGERGPQGLPGQAGKDAQPPAIEAIVAEVVKQIPPAKSCECKQQGAEQSRPSAPIAFDIEPLE